MGEHALEVREAARASWPAVALGWIARVLLAVPAVWLTLFWSLVVRARLMLGYWPYPRTGNLFDGTYDYPLDPKVMPLHSNAVWLLLWVAPLTWLAAPAAGLLARALETLPRARWWALGWVLTTSAMWLVLFVDPGSFYLWFLD